MTPKPLKPSRERLARSAPRLRLVRQPRDVVVVRLLDEHGDDNRGEGAQISFTPNPSGSAPHAWCPSSSQADYCAVSPRIIATLNKNPDGSWSFTRYVDSAMTFTFRSDGSLSEIEDAFGDTLRAESYSPVARASCPANDTCTAWVGSASGRELVLVMNPPDSWWRSSIPRAGRRRRVRELRLLQQHLQLGRRDPGPLLGERTR